MFGSLNNRINERKAPKVPEVGMGATLLMYSDRHAYTIVHVDPNGKRLTAKRDIAKRVDSNGMSDSQSWTYTPDTNAASETFTLRKDGRWHAGNTMKGDVLAIGYRDEYYDYSF